MCKGKTKQNPNTFYERETPLWVMALILTKQKTVGTSSLRGSDQKEAVSRDLIHSQESSCNQGNQLL